jgi:hypothetical protein
MCWLHNFQKYLLPWKIVSDCKQGTSDERRDGQLLIPHFNAMLTHELDDLVAFANHILNIDFLLYMMNC